MRYSDAASAIRSCAPGSSPRCGRSVAACFGILLILIAVTARRSRPWPMPWVAWLIAAGAAIAAGVVHVAPTLRLVTVEAYPTSFYVSPTRYSASSIVQGADLFATHCASCHGPRGRGDGRAGRFFRVKPSDLTADHVYGHSDGDLYWWITNGIGEVMPPFGVALDEAARWNVIDFVRANADAARLDRAAGKVTNAGYRAPDFSAVCPDGSIVRATTCGAASRISSSPGRRWRSASPAAAPPRCRHGAIRSRTSRPQPPAALTTASLRGARAVARQGGAGTSTARSFWWMRRGACARSGRPAASPTGATPMRCNTRSRPFAAARRNANHRLAPSWALMPSYGRRYFGARLLDAICGRFVHTSCQAEEQEASCRALRNREGRARERDRMGHPQPARQAQRDEPAAALRHARCPRRARA